MIEKRRLIRAGAVLLAALAVGHFMQSGAAAAKFAAPDQIEKATPNPEPEELSNALPTPPVEMILPEGLAQPKLSNGVRVAAVSFDIGDKVQNDAPTPSFYQVSCDIAVTVLPKADAMVLLQVDAPCYRNQRIEIGHVGLEFADTTSGAGTYEVLIPVFDDTASFDVAFADGNSAKAKTLGMVAEDFNRVAVNWQGGPGIHIHALEYGAQYGDPGHIWAESAGEAAEGGFLVQLGNPNQTNPILAEVYSFPGDNIQKNGAVRVIIEAEVTAQTCGSVITGNTVEIAPGQPVLATAVSVTMPECNDVGGFLVLKNLLQDMKIAQN